MQSTSGLTAWPDFKEILLSGVCVPTVAVADWLTHAAVADTEFVFTARFWGHCRGTQTYFYDRFAKKVLLLHDNGSGALSDNRCARPPNKNTNDITHDSARDRPTSLDP